MLRSTVEKHVGSLADNIWSETCRIADSYLIARNNFKFMNDPQYVLTLCIGVASFLKDGHIQKGA